MEDKYKELIMALAELILTRDDDVTTQDGDFATVDISSITEAEEFLVKAFNLDSDGIFVHDLGHISEQLSKTQLGGGVMETLRYSPVIGNYEGVIVVNKIARLSKGSCGEITYIHLMNGEIIESEDSINTLEARINKPRGE
tara:strand:- start:6 stop:428 length:423 start_codon:yes stop_codon:yes gene_type:complete